MAWKQIVMNGADLPDGFIPEEPSEVESNRIARINLQGAIEKLPDDFMTDEDATELISAMGDTGWPEIESGKLYYSSIEEALNDLRYFMDDRHQN